MSTDNKVVPIRGGGDPPAPPKPPKPPRKRRTAQAERLALERRGEIELSAQLMGQAVEAAIALIDDEQPQIACDVLRLARDRWLATWEVQS